MLPFLYLKEKMTGHTSRTAQSQAGMVLVVVGVSQHKYKASIM